MQDKIARKIQKTERTTIQHESFFIAKIYEESKISLAFDAFLLETRNCPNLIGINTLKKDLLEAIVKRSKLHKRFWKKEMKSIVEFTSYGLKILIFSAIPLKGFSETVQCSEYTMRLKKCMRNTQKWTIQLKIERKVLKSLEL